MKNEWLNLPKACETIRMIYEINAPWNPKLLDALSCFPQTMKPLWGMYKVIIEHDVIEVDVINVPEGFDHKSALNDLKRVFRHDLDHKERNHLWDIMVKYGITVYGTLDQMPEQGSIILKNYWKINSKDPSEFDSVPTILDMAKDQLASFEKENPGVKADYLHEFNFGGSGRGRIIRHDDKSEQLVDNTGLTNKILNRQNTFIGLVGLGTMFMMWFTSDRIEADLRYIKALVKFTWKAVFE